MEQKKLKHKKKISGDCKLKLPLKNQKEIVGVFNGLNVVIHDWSSMNYLYEKGCFGKGSFSKRKPNYHTKKDDIPKIIFKQQLENQHCWNSSFNYVCPQKHCGSNDEYELSKVSVQKFLESSLDDTSDSLCQKSWVEQPENQINLKNELSYLEFHTGEEHGDEKLRDVVNEILQSKKIRAPFSSSERSKNEVIVLSLEPNMTFSNVESLDVRLKDEVFLPEENLNLNLEESLYLSSALDCLTVIDSNEKKLTSSELWEKFKAVDQNFVKRYVAYHYFRSKGWIVKSGVKFGGDYLLYKVGPAYYHSNYLVKILSEEKMSWRELIASNRLVETFNKEIVFVKVSPCNVEKKCAAFPDLLADYTVETTLISRWFPSKERLQKI